MLSLILRRSHMYVALFLMPWVFLYALSTMTMNHGEWIHSLYGEPRVHFQVEAEHVFDGRFPEGATPKQKALQILSGLGLEGNHTVRVEPGGRLVMQRQDMVTPRRISYSPESGRLVIERETFRAANFLERFHRRRGFQTPYLADDVWAVIVDAVIVAILFWSFSGLWMWWEMPTTRNWGWLAIAGGLLIFLGFLFTI